MVVLADIVELVEVVDVGPEELLVVELTLVDPEVVLDVVVLNVVVVELIVVVT